MDPTRPPSDQPTALQPAPVTALETFPAADELPPDRNPVTVYLARLGPGSRADMERSLRLIVRLVSGQPALDPRGFPWGALRYQHTQAVRAALAERYAPGGANRHLAALRGVLKEAWRLGLMSAEDHARAADVESVRGQTLPAGRALSAGDLRALFEACAARGGATGARDAVALTLLYGCGLRRSEAVAIDLSDYDHESGEVAVRKGKGRKQRLVYATSGGRAALAAWLAQRGPEPGPLLCPVAKGGARIELRRMTSHSVLHLVRRVAHAARVLRFSPHDLRRTFVSNLLDAGADIATVKELAGHASITTTARYDRRGERAKQKASELLNVPYVPPSLSAGPRIPS